MRRLREWVPRWWSGAGGPVGRALDGGLWPAEQLYRAIVRVRNRGYDAGWLASDDAPIPVVSIGNLTVGGAGKTPAAAWTARWLAERGARPAVVLRGYGSDEVQVHRELNPGIPVFVGRRRVEAVREAAGAGCGVAVLDDGFQHRRLRRDLDVALVAAEQWAARRKLLPRGPWREEIGALERAAVAVVTRKSASRETAAALAAELAQWVPGGRTAVARLEPVRLEPVRPGTDTPRDLAELSGRRVLAVASLADPAPFIRQLEEVGAHVELRAFPDHHDFSAAEATQLAEAAGARWLVMTRKEAVKLRALLPAGAAAFLLAQRFELEDRREVVESALAGVVERVRR